MSLGWWESRKTMRLCEHRTVRAVKDWDEIFAVNQNACYRQGEAHPKGTIIYSFRCSAIWQKRNNHPQSGRSSVNSVFRDEMLLHSTPRRRSTVLYPVLFHRWRLHRSGHGDKIARYLAKELSDYYNRTQHSENFSKNGTFTFINIFANGAQRPQSPYKHNDRSRRRSTALGSVGWATA